MISWIAGKALGFMGVNQWFLAIVGVLLVSTALAGKLLLSSHEEVGRQKALVVTERSNVAKWQASNEILDKAYKALNAKLLARERINRQIKKELNEALTSLRGVTDETNCAFTTMPDDVVLQFKPTGDNSTD